MAVGVLVALTLAGTLAACEGRPGAAAVVDGTAVTTADVRAGTAELSPILPSVTSLNVLTVLVQAPTVLAFAQEQGAGVSDQQALDLLDQIAAQAGPTRRTFTEPSLVVAKYSIAIDHLQAQPTAADLGAELTQRLADLDVTVNPRFASLGDGNALTAPVRRPWLVAPEPADSGSGAPEPSPTPTPTPSS